MHFDCVIKNGIVVFPGRFMDYLDLAIENGKISGFFSRGKRISADRIIDASEMYVMPGVVDAHMHLGFTDNLVKEFDRESSCAALGGVTTYIAYILQSEPYSSTHNSLIKIGSSNSIVDFGFHYTIVSKEQLKEIDKYVKDFGISSFKYLMTSRGTESKRLGLEEVDDGFLISFLSKVSNNKSIPCVHCENIEIFWALQPQVENLDINDLSLWNMSRPPYSEAEGIFRAVYLAEKTNCSKIYIVHLSSQEGLEVVRWLKNKNLRTKIIVETCPHYLTLNINSEIGKIAKVNPPLREQKDVDALWEAIKKEEIEVIASDHVARPKSTKEGNIWKASPGFPGIGTLLSLVLDEGYHKRGISLEKISELISRNPAKVFGLYPKKGEMAIGSDADLIIVNLNLEKKINYLEQNSISDYNIYEGRKTKGWPVLTMVRGNKVMENGRILEGHKFGEFILRYPKI